jgi:hypothetical protein
MRQTAKKAAIEKVAPRNLSRTCARLCHSAAGELEQIHFLLRHRSVETTEKYFGSRGGSRTPLMISWSSSPMKRRAEELTANPTLRGLRSLCSTLLRVYHLPGEIDPTPERRLLFFFSRKWVLRLGSRRFHVAHGVLRAIRNGYEERLWFNRFLCWVGSS